MCITPAGDKVVASPPLPTTPIDQAQRARRPVRSNGGVITARRVLQRQVISAEQPAYAIDYVHTQATKSGSKILVATPMKPRDEACTSLVSCGPPVVIKVVPHSKKDAKKNPLTEIAALQRLMQDAHQHPKVIHLMDCMQDQDFVYLILPFLYGGDLFTRVASSGDKGLPETEARSYIRQMCEGLLFMKETNGLAHRDVSLQNVLLSSRDHDNLKVVDLALCVQAPQQAAGKVDVEGESSEFVKPVPQPLKGKLPYLAPEVVTGKAYDPFPADIWSLGVCLYIMLTGRPLYTSPDDQAFKVMAKGGNVVEMYEKFGLILPSCAKELVCRMVHADPKKRPTLEEVLAHPFVKASVYDCSHSPRHFWNQ